MLSLRVLHPALTDLPIGRLLVLRRLARFWTVGLLLVVCTTSAGSADSELSIDQIDDGTKIGSFHAVARYRIGEDGYLGARFVHEPTGMPVDLLVFDSVPQAMVWIHSAPNSNRGEPHTLEHLVLGKGIKGRLYSLGLDMSLGSHSAATWRDKTLYHFHTAGGAESFSENLFHMLDTLCEPDFTDEEIRREVAHLGVVEDEETGRLSLEEKGTVYVEMISSFEKPGSVIWSEIRRLLYGPDHPLGLESGGIPTAIRTMAPEDIRRFHRERYVPGPGMGLIVGLPPQIPVDQFLPTLETILANVLDGAPAKRHAIDPLEGVDLPHLDPVIRVLPFPSATASERSSAILAWSPRKDLSPIELYRLQVLWHLLSGDETSYLHRDLVDSKTRKGPSGLTSVEGWVEDTQGFPPMIWLDGVDPSLANADSMSVIRDLMTDRLKWIASLEPGSSDLEELNERARTYLLAQRRWLLQQVEAPPRFGYRGTGDFWYLQLRELAREPGFEKDLILEQKRTALLDDLDRGNLWSDLIERSGLIDDPSIAVARPDTLLSEQQARAKTARLAEAVEAIKAEYGTDDDQEALRRYKTDFDARTAELEEIEAGIPQPGLLADPPLTMDDMIDSHLEGLSISDSSPSVSSIPFCVNRFRHTAMIDAGLYFDLEGTPESLLLYLPVLPVLVTELGCRGNDGVWIDYDELKQRLQREVYDVSASPSVFMRGTEQRVELSITGTGLGLEEGKTALGWIERLLTSATQIEPDALGRLRDLIQREIASGRQRMMGAEENWATNPAQAYRFEGDKVYLSISSIFTRLHHLNRVDWRLRDVPSKATLAWLEAKLDSVATRAQGRRADLRLGLEHLADGLDETTEPAASLVRAVATYLTAEIDNVPPASVESDFRRLCGQVVEDLAVPPEAVTNNLQDLVRQLLQNGPSRVHLTGTGENTAEIEPELRGLIERLTHLSAPSAPIASIVDRDRSTRGVVSSNLSDRNSEVASWLEKTGCERVPFAALPLESTRNALFTNTKPLISYDDPTREGLVDFLAAKVYGGGGAHGAFMKTWGAGLAYSNGIGAGARSGMVSYYAERCSDGVETLRFVGNLLEGADATLNGNFFLDYALANAFSDYRGGSTYLSRGRSMADDWADGITPEQVRHFKGLLLKMREEWSGPEESVDAEPIAGGEALLAQLRTRMPDVLGPVLPGYGASVGESRDVVSFMIGPSDQIDRFEEYLRSQEESAPVVRLYPRDYWID